MEQFTLDVRGFEGEALMAAVSFEGTVIEEFEARNLKDAERKARAIALAYVADNSPANRVAYSRTFTV